MDATTPTRIIKRYANRKLYDTRDSKYVTLEQISEMIRNGEEIKVIDNGSKEDLTSVTLAQILFEEERKRSFLPLAALRKIIQTSGESLHELMQHLSESAGRVFRREDEELTQGGEGDASGVASEAGDRPAHVEQTGALREFIENVQHTIDGWQRRFDSNINAALETVSPFAPLKSEVRTLRSRIAELESKLAQIETHANQSAPTEKSA